MQQLESFFSSNARNMKRSVIRELLKLTRRPNIISFAGGLPSPDTFPVQDLAEAAQRVFDSSSASALQYGATEGDLGLKEELIAWEARDGNALTLDKILIVSASQQALDIVAKIFLNPGDIVVAGRPTYVGAIGAINSYQAKIVGVPFSPDDDGLDMNALRTTLDRLVPTGKVKFIYIVPDFQNPAGICWSLEKRRQLLEIAYQHNLLIIEDSPYREIRFVGEHIPSVYHLDTRECVVGLKTFSKILVPGTRLGWMIGPEEIISKCVMAKQSMDLCTNTLSQKIMAEYLKTGKLPLQIQNTIKLYGAKRNRMLEALEREMPSHPEVSWTRPEGGLFLWLRLPQCINTDDMFPKAVEKDVAYVVGSAFYAENAETNAMRLNFSFASFEQIDEGIKRLANVIRAELDERC